MDTKKALKAFHAKAKAIVDRIAKDRDALRHLVDEYASILESVDEGVHDFEHALDTLSGQL